MAYESITKEGLDSVSHVSEEFVELLLGLEFIVLSQSRIIVSKVLPNFLIESVSQWGYH